MSLDTVSLGWDETIRPSQTYSPIGDNNKRKRRLDDFSPPSRRAAPAHGISSPGIKKMRHHTRRAVPIRRRIEALSHRQLVELVERLCDQNPESCETVSRLAPTLGVDSALGTLKGYLNKIYENMPYRRSDSEVLDDYSYLRMQPFVQEFFLALADYTTSFLPPYEESLTTTLEFLDKATELVHMVPDWATTGHNFLKNRAYSELSEAWAYTLRSVAQRAPFGLFHPGLDCEARLKYHTDRSDGRLQVPNEIPDQPSFLMPQPNIVCP